MEAEGARTGLGLARFRRRVAFELFLRRLVAVAEGGESRRAAELVRDRLDQGETVGRSEPGVSVQGIRPSFERGPGRPKASKEGRIQSA